MTAAAFLRVVRAGVAKNWTTSITYPSWLANRIFGPIVWVGIALYSYTALVPEADVRSAFAREGEGVDFAGFLILGQAVFSLFSTLNFRGGMAIQRERWQGTLEAILLAPASRVAYLLGESVFGLVESGWTVLLALVVTGIAFGADFQVANAWLAGAAVAATLASMVALSLFFAAFYVLTRSAGPLSFAVQTPVRFFSGATFPVTVLPPLLQAVSYAIPMTYGTIAVRGAFLGTRSEAELVRMLGVLVLFTALFWTLGVLAVRRMERLAKERGTLHEY